MPRYDTLKEHINREYGPEGGFDAWEEVIASTEGQKPTVRLVRLAAHFTTNEKSMSPDWARRLLKRYYAEKAEGKI